MLCFVILSSSSLLHELNLTEAVFQQWNVKAWKCAWFLLLALPDSFAHASKKWENLSKIWLVIEINLCSQRCVYSQKVRTLSGAMSQIITKTWSKTHQFCSENCKNLKFLPISLYFSFIMDIKPIFLHEKLRMGVLLVPMIENYKQID